MDFGTWLHAQRGREDAVGDLAAEVGMKPPFSLYSLMIRLEGKGVRIDVWRAIQVAAEEYWRQTARGSA